MERVLNSEFEYSIMVITSISGDNGRFTVTFETKNEKGYGDRNFYRLIFENVYGLSYSTENMNIDRFGTIENRKNVTSDICIIENSEYIKYFKNTTFEHLDGTEQLKHYVITDGMDTVVDILEAEYTDTKKPKIEKFELEEDISVLRNELLQLKWWNKKENISVIQKELDELRAYKDKREKEDKKAREEEINRNSFGF